MPDSRYRVDVILDENDLLCEIRILMGSTILIANAFELLRAATERNTFCYDADVRHV